MPNVGRPNNNPSRMEPRSVPVEKDKPRINDERKVRPHAAGEPPMGIRPNHPGAQKAPIAPPDKLNAEYIQARDVPMATMTEAELAEWNPFARSGPSLGDLSAKISKLEAGMEKMKQDRNAMVIQIGQLMRAVNPNSATPTGNSFRRQMGMGAGLGAGGSTAPATEEPRRQERGYGTPYPKPFVNNKQQWDKKTGKTGAFDAPSPAPTARPAAPSQMAPAAAPSGAPRDVSGGITPEEQIRFLKLQNPEKYNDITVKNMTPYQIDKAYNKAVNMQGRGSRMHEGYPDKSFERNEPAHSSRIGDLKWKGKAHEAKPPRTNRDFMQARDISVERVHENADREMDDLIAQTIAKMGLAEAMGGPEVDHVTLPAHWASALVNGDFSGLDDDEADQCQMMMHKLAQEGWHVVDTAEDEPRFTWNYQVHNPHSQYKGGDVIDYVIHRQQQAAPPAQPMPGAQLENREHTGRDVTRGPAGAAPVSETKLPRARARWV